MEKYSDILTAHDLMVILGIGKNKAYKLLGAGEIQAVRVGNTWRILLSEVQRYLGYQPRLNKTKFTI